MYRINFLIVTVLLGFIGCGGPGEGRLYEIEKQLGQTDVLAERVAVLEKVGEGSGEVESKLETLSRRVDQVQQQLAKVEQTMASQLGTAATAESGFDPTELSNRIASVEKKLAAMSVRERAMELSRGTAAGDSSASFGSSDVVKPPAMTADLATAKKVGTNSKPSGAGGFQTTLFSWNVESEGSDPKVIAKQLAELNRYDIYGLCEVLPESIELYADALGDDFKTIASRSGFNDRLQIIYNNKVYKLLRRLELDEINFERRYRSPLVAHLEHRATGQQLLVMNNHLARGRAEVREQQAKQLVEWARDQTVPIVAVGDYNFDYVFSTRQGNDGFVAMMRDGIWKWIEPAELIDTNWYDSPKRPDGIDDYPGSMLDFAFVAGASTTWKTECRIITREGDFPDDETTSDHRPFELRLIAN